MAAKSSFNDTNQSRTLLSSSKGAFLVLDGNNASLSPCSSYEVASRLAMLQFPVLCGGISSSGG